MDEVNPVAGILPIKNGLPWVQNIERTILPSLGKRRELIVIDDGSTDGTFEKLRQIAKRNEQIVLVKNRNQGLCAALNYGLEITSSQFVARFDIDDDYLPNRVDEQITLLKNDCVAAFTDYQIIGMNNQNLGIIHSPLFEKQTALSLISSERTAHPSAIINKSAVKEVGGYRESDFPVEDLSLWIRLLKVGTLRTLPAVKLKYRLHGKSVTALNMQLTLEKTKSLINNNQIRLVFNQISQDLPWFLEQYSNENLSQLRKVLFLRDLYIASEIFDEQKFKKNLLRQIYPIGYRDLIGFLGVSIETIYFKLKRDYYRKHNFGD